MKKYLFLIFAAQLLFAQSPDLLNTNWQISKIIYNGQTFFPPPMPYTQGTQFSVTAPNLNAAFFNTAQGNLIYNAGNTFQKQSLSCTLADYWGDNGEVNQFFGFNCDFFMDSGNFVYSITTNGTNKNLVITNSAGNQIYYSYSFLETEEMVSASLKFYPNPVTDILVVEDQDYILSAMMYDLSGKLVYEGKYTRIKQIKIDMKSLKSGVYLLRLNDRKTFNIIKK